MTRVYNVFDKFSILTIAIGFILGIFLAFNNTSSNVWFDAIPIIIIIAAIMTLPPLIDLLHAMHKYGEEFSIPAIVEAFLLNVAILVVCTAFGIVAGTVYINNFIAN